MSCLWDMFKDSTAHREHEQDQEAVGGLFQCPFFKQRHPPPHWYMNKLPFFTNCSWILLQKSTVLMKGLCPKPFLEEVENAGISWRFRFWSASSGNLIHFLIKVQSLCFVRALIVGCKDSLLLHAHTLKSGYSQTVIWFWGLGHWVGKTH